MSKTEGSSENGKQSKRRNGGIGPYYANATPIYVSKVIRPCRAGDTDEDLLLGVVRACTGFGDGEEEDEKRKKRDKEEEGGWYRLEVKYIRGIGGVEGGGEGGDEEREGGGGGRGRHGGSQLEVWVEELMNKKNESVIVRLRGIRVPSRVSLQCKVRRLPGTTRGLGIRSAIGRIRVCIGKAPCFKRFEKAKVAQILSSDPSTSMVPDQTSKADEAGIYLFQAAFFFPFGRVLSFKLYRL